MNQSFPLWLRGAATALAFLLLQACKGDPVFVESVQQRKKPIAKAQEPPPTETVVPIPYLGDAWGQPMTGLLLGGSPDDDSDGAEDKQSGDPSGKNSSDGSVEHEQDQRIQRSEFTNAEQLIEAFNQEKDETKRAVMRHQIRQCMTWFCSQSLATLEEEDMDEYMAFVNIKHDQGLLRSYFNTLVDKISTDQYQSGEEYITQALAASLPLIDASVFKGNTVPLQKLSEKLLSKLEKLSSDDLHAQSYATHGLTLDALYESLEMLSRVRRVENVWKQGGIYSKFKEVLQQLKKKLHKPDRWRRTRLVLKPGCYPYKYKIELLLQSVKRKKAPIDFYDKACNGLKRAGKAFQGTLQICKGLRGLLSLEIDTKAFGKGYKKWLEALRLGTVKKPWYNLVSGLGQIRACVLREAQKFPDFAALFQSYRDTYQILTGPKEDYILLRYGMVQQVVNLGVYTQDTYVRNQCNKLLAELEKIPSWSKDDTLTDAISVGTQKISCHINKQKGTRTSILVLAHNASTHQDGSVSLETMCKRLNEKRQRPAAFKDIHSTEDFIKAFKALGGSEADSKKRGLFLKYLEAYNTVVQEQLNKASLWFNLPDIQEYSQLAQLSHHGVIDTSFWEKYMQVWCKAIEKNTSIPSFAKGIQQMLDAINLEFLDANPTLLIQLARSLLKHLSQNKAQYTEASFNSYKDVLIALQYTLVRIAGINKQETWDSAAAEGLYQEFLEAIKKIEQSGCSAFQCQALLLRASLAQLKTPLGLKELKELPGSLLEGCLKTLGQLRENPSWEGIKQLPKYFEKGIKESAQTTIRQLREPIWYLMKGLTQCTVGVTEMLLRQPGMATTCFVNGGTDLHRSFGTLWDLTYDHLAQHIGKWLAMLKEAKNYIPTAGDLLQLSLAASEKLEDYALFWEGLELLTEKAKKADEATRRMLYKGLVEQLTALAEKGIELADQTQVVDHLELLLREAIEACNQKLIKAVLQGLKTISNVSASEQLRKRCREIITCTIEEIEEVYRQLEQPVQELAREAKETTRHVASEAERAVDTVKEPIKQFTQKARKRAIRLLSKFGLGKVVEGAEEVLDGAKQGASVCNRARKEAISAVEKISDSCQDAYEEIGKKHSTSKRQAGGSQTYGRLFSVITEKAMLGVGLILEQTAEIDHALSKTQSVAEATHNKVTQLNKALGQLLDRLHAYEGPTAQHKITSKIKEKSQEELVQCRLQMQALSQKLKQQKHSFSKEQYEATELLLTKSGRQYQQADGQLKVLEAQLQKQFKRVLQAQQESQQAIVAQVVSGQLKTSKEIDGAISTLTATLEQRLTQQDESQRKFIVEQIEGLRQMIKVVAQQFMLKQTRIGLGRQSASTSLEKERKKYAEFVQGYAKGELKRGIEKREKAEKAMLVAMQLYAAGKHRAAASKFDTARNHFLNARQAFEGVLEQISEDYKEGNLTSEQHDAIQTLFAKEKSDLPLPEALKWLRAYVTYLRGQGPFPAGFALIKTSQGFLLEKESKQ